MPQLLIHKGTTFFREFVFAQTPLVLIGRTRPADIQLPDETRRVSRQHAAIVRAPGDRGAYFVRDLGSDPMSRAIVNAVAQIGHQRGLKVVAEWVDGEHTLAVLRELGVDYGQGFVLHRPQRVLFQRPDHGGRQVAWARR